MKEYVVDIRTPDGVMNSVVMHPEEGGPFPVAVCLMDSCGLRDDFLELARRLAVAGYFVVTPNAYYRAARDVDLDPDRVDSEDPTYEEGRKMMWELNRSITADGWERDMRALFAWVDACPQAMAGPAGVYGYYLGGRLALSAAAAMPERIAAAASLHGGGFVKDDSSKAGAILGEVYLAHAGTDKYIPMERIEGIERMLTQQPSADRAWERVFALFRRNLPQAAAVLQAHRSYTGIATI